MGSDSDTIHTSPFVNTLDMPLPAVGTPAPDFELLDDRGDAVRLADLRGKRVVLFFYPKADTPGCIKESCGFRDNYRQFAEQDVIVLGISPDTVEAQVAFRSKYGFQYPLLADHDHQVAESYGVWQEKDLLGDPHYGVVRTTFLIDAEGTIGRVFERVDPEGHSQEVLEALAAAEAAGL